MSISTIVNRNFYEGNNAVDTYPYLFLVFKDSDLRVVEKDLLDVETVLTLGVNYTVTGVRNPDGGTVVRTAGNLPTGYTWTIRRVVELLQGTDIRNQGDFFPEIHEDQFDRHVMADQQQQEEIDRSVRNPESISPVEFSPILPADIATADRALVTNATGDGFALGLPSVDATRIFNKATYAEHKALALLDPTALRWGWATDIKKLVFYTTEIGEGDQGWIVQL